MLGAAKRKWKDGENPLLQLARSRSFTSCISPPFAFNVARFSVGDKPKHTNRKRHYEAALGISARQSKDRLN